MGGAHRQVANILREGSDLVVPEGLGDMAIGHDRCRGDDSDARKAHQGGDVTAVVTAEGGRNGLAEHPPGVRRQQGE